MRVGGGWRRGRVAVARGVVERCVAAESACCLLEHSHAHKARDVDGCQRVSLRRHGGTARLGWRVGARCVSAGGWAHGTSWLEGGRSVLECCQRRSGMSRLWEAADGHGGVLRGTQGPWRRGWLGLGSRAGRTESKTKPSPKCARSAASHFALDEMISDFSIERSASCVPITYLLGLGSGLGPGLGLGLGCGYRRRKRA